MNPIIEEHKESIRALAKEYGVLRLEVFGSVCTPDWDPATSDIDFIVDYPEDYEFGLWLKRYFELKKRLEALLGHPVDLVMADAMRKPRFIEAANQTRHLLYAA